MLREHIHQGDDLGRQVRAVMQAGRLVPDELVNRLVVKRISRPDCRNGFILDGYPRTVQQADFLGKLLAERQIEQVVIHLQVDYNKVIARLTGRRQCPLCGTLYSLTSQPPKVADVCDLDGTRLVVREDDREEVIRERLEAYERQTTPLLEHFAKLGRAFHRVDASDDPPATILQRIRQLIRDKDDHS